MKTAISVPDRVFQKAEKLAKRLKKSRSQLYSEALLEYVSRHDPASITSALDAVYGSEEDSRPDRLLSDAADRVLRSTEW
jgi:hypothetical protein